MNDDWEINTLLTSVPLLDDDIRRRGDWPDEIVLTKWEFNSRGEKRIAEEQRYLKVKDRAGN